MFFRISLNNRKKLVYAFKKVELNKIVLKSLLRDFSFLNIYRFYFNYKLSSYNKSTFFTAIRRSCFLTNYPKSFIRFFKLSRHQAKFYASDGYLNGIRKSSF